MRDDEKLLHDQPHTTQSKYTYFLLFIAASAIALVIKITETDVLSLSLIPLGLALFFQSISHLHLKAGKWLSYFFSPCFCYI